jgi:hypothetical protein
MLMQTQGGRHLVAAFVAAATARAVTGPVAVATAGAGSAAVRAGLVVAGVSGAGVVAATLAGVGREAAPTAAAATAANEARQLPVSCVSKRSAAGGAVAAGR